MKPRPTGDSFWRGLEAGGLTGVVYVVSDDHGGLKAALNATMPGVLWQRCQFHLQRNAMAYVPKVSMRKAFHNDIRDIFGAPDRYQAQQRLRLYVQKYQEIAPKLSAWMEENLPEGLTVFALPEKPCRRMRTN